MNGGDGRLPVGVGSAVLGRFDAGAPCFDGEGAWGWKGRESGRVRRPRRHRAPKSKGPEIVRPDGRASTRDSAGPGQAVHAARKRPAPRAIRRTRAAFRCS
ncbi:hypothetical protein X989_5790 [Burkholderia pseudomallei MSHR4378]|nr:hypothetical protein X989_5790 [Burkholderia pseudomallei MSHR4378]